MVNPMPTETHLPSAQLFPDLSSLCLTMTEHAPLPMATLEGPNHIVRYVNGAFCRLIEKTQEELVGKPFAEMVPEKDECLALVGRVYRTGKHGSLTEHKQGGSHPAFWSYTIWPVITYAGPVGVMLQVTETTKFHEQTVAMTEALMLGLVRQDELIEAADSSNAQLQEEIMEREEAEQALQRAQTQLSDRAGQLEGLVAKRTAELNATNQQLEAFVYSIAHDLRAPLRSMQGFSALLVDDANTTLSTSSRDFANRINHSAQFMDALLSDLLAFSRVSQQRVELTSVNLETVVASVVSRLRDEIHEKAAQVETSGPWPFVQAHELTLIQVLFNLVSNALKFAVPGVPPLLRVRAEEKKEFVRVWVEDNGIGIAPEYQNQIFGLFTRLHGEKYQGTGIGLAIVQKGVERMGGQMGVESTPGHGSRFWFELRST
jgi:signal transduction histidine kinase